MKRPNKKAPKPKQKARRMMARPGLLLDATRDGVLGLPRPVGKYMVVRTTTTVSAVANFCNVFCPFIVDDGVTVAKWMPMVGVRDVNAGLAINAANNTRPVLVTGLDQFSQGLTEIVPAHFSVRVINSNALQTTSGTIYLGRLASSFDAGGSTLTWTDAFNNFLSSSKPRAVSAAYLALNTLHADAVPIEFDELSDFMGVIATSSITNPFTWGSDAYKPGALSPLYVFNPAGVALDFQITVQWRVRLDANNPLASSHVNVPLTDGTVWQSAIQDVESLGESFMEVKAVQAVAPYAMTAFRAARAGVAAA